MNLEKLSRMPLPVLAAGMVIGGVSCVNEQYDLNKGIDMTIGLDANISVPVGSTEFIGIGDFLKIEESEDNMIVMDETTGDYYLSFAGKEPFSSKIEIPEINLETTRSETVTVMLDINDNADLKDYISDDMSFSSTLSFGWRECGYLLLLSRLDMTLCLSTMFSRTSMVFSCSWLISRRNSSFMSSPRLTFLLNCSISFDISSIISASRSILCSSMLTKTIYPLG